MKWVGGAKNLMGLPAFVHYQREESGRENKKRAEDSALDIWFSTTTASLPRVGNPWYIAQANPQSHLLPHNSFPPLNVQFPFSNITSTSHTFYLTTYPSPRLPRTMKVFTIVFLALFGVLTVLAAPSARQKPLPGELTMAKAHVVFEGGTRPPGVASAEPDKVPPTPKVSLNPSDTGNFWYCSRANGCYQLSPEYVCCDFGCCPPGFDCCGSDGYCWRSWFC